MRSIVLSVLRLVSAMKLSSEFGDCLKATSIPGLFASKPCGDGRRYGVHRPARRAARCPWRRARRRARPSGSAGDAGSATSPRRTRAWALSRRVPVIVVVVVLGRRAPLAQVLGLVGGEAAVERLQADAEHVGRLSLRARLGEGSLA